MAEDTVDLVVLVLDIEARRVAKAFERSLSQVVELNRVQLVGGIRVFQTHHGRRTE